MTTPDPYPGCRVQVITVAGVLALAVIFAVLFVATVQSLVHP